MPTFRYKAKKGPQENISGIVEAKNEQQAVLFLEQKGLSPIIIQEAVNEKDSHLSSSLKRIRRQDIVIFTRQFANLIESGLTITEGLNVLAKQASNPALKNIILEIESRIKDGSTFSESLSYYPKQFSQFYCAIVKAGEISGALEVVLDRLADFAEHEEEVRSDILATLTYPSLIMTVASITVYVLLTFIVPKLTSMFEEMGQTLPLATRILIGISGVLGRYWWLLLSLIVIAAFMFRRISKIPEQKLLFDRIILKLPVIGDIIQKSEIAHFVRTLSLLLESGVSMLVSLGAVGDTVTNKAIKGEIDKITQDIRDGISLSSAFTKSLYFPAYVSNIIKVGEEGGTLEKSLKRIAVSYEQELNRKVRALTSLLEPIMILIMGLIVAFIVVAMLLPIFQINLIAR